jgi:hypothetical protein
MKSFLTALFAKLASATPTEKKDVYSYCETWTAGSNTPWHIRKLTDAGKKLGGGADTPSLCNRTVDWDVNCPFDTKNRIIPVCKKCKDVYLVTQEQA